jgi:hypothetical protein
MDDVVNRLARELVEAISRAVADDPRVEACREKARAAGYEMRVSLEATIGFAGRIAPGTKPPRAQAARPQPVQRALEMSANDRRFLRSLRIAADEQAEKQVE